MKISLKIIRPHLPWGHDTALSTSCREIRRTGTAGPASQVAAAAAAGQPVRAAAAAAAGAARHVTGRAAIALQRRRRVDRQPRAASAAAAGQRLELLLTSPSPVQRSAGSHSHRPAKTGGVSGTFL